MPSEQWNTSSYERSWRAQLSTSPEDVVRYLVWSGFEFQEFVSNLPYLNLTMDGKYKLTCYTIQYPELSANGSSMWMIYIHHE
jgi:hypothetical protein